jgi:hypothetical protein
LIGRMKFSALSRPPGVSLRDISMPTPSDNLTEDTLPAPLPFGFKPAYGIEKDRKVCRESG